MQEDYIGLLNGPTGINKEADASSQSDALRQIIGVVGNEKIHIYHLDNQELDNITNVIASYGKEVTFQYDSLDNPGISLLCVGENNGSEYGFSELNSTTFIGVVDGEEKKMDYQETKAFVNEYFSEGAVTPDNVVDAVNDYRRENFPNDMEGAPVEMFDRDNYVLLDEPEEHVKAEIDTSIYDNISKITENFDTSVIDKGWMPPEIREVLSGSQDDIEKIRKEGDPGFGRILGIDTTNFDNFSYIDNIKFEDVKDNIRQDVYKDSKIEVSRFTEDNIESFKVYKEYNPEQTVYFDEMGERPFHMNNLVTFEIKLKGDDTPYRSSFIIDDSGSVIREVGIHSDKTALEFRENERIDALNLYRDEPESRQEEIFQEIDDKREGWCRYFVNDFMADIGNINCSAEITKRLDFLDKKIEVLNADKSEARAIINKLEIYREIEGTKIAKTAIPLDKEAMSFRQVYDKSTSVKKDSPEYEDTMNKLDAALDRLKEPYVKYMRTAQSVEMGSINHILEKSNSIYAENKSYRYEMDKEMCVNDINREASYTDQYLQLIDVEAAQDSKGIFDVYADKIHDILQADGFLNEINDSINQMIDKYNDELPNNRKEFCQVHIGKDGNIYTAFGFSVEPYIRFNQAGIMDLSERDIYERFNMDEIRLDDRTLDRLGITSEYRPRYADSFKMSYDIDSINKFYNAEIKGTAFKDRPNVTVGFAEERFINMGIYSRIGSRYADKIEQACRQDDAADKKEQMLASGFRTADKDIFLSILKAVDTHLKDEKIPDIKVLKEESKQFRNADNTAQDVEVRNNTESKDDIDNTDSPDRDETQEEKFYKRSAMPYARTNNEKDVSISKEKMSELRQEASKEAEGDTEKAESIFQEKYNDLKNELTEIKNDIVHYNKQMERFGDIPFKLKSQHTYYQIAKNEYDSAVKKYQDLGGEVGKDCFVEKGISKLEAIAGRLDVVSSNIILTRIMEPYTDRKGGFNLSDLYKREDKDGKIVEVDKYSSSSIKYGGRIQSYEKGIGRIPVKIFGGLSKYTMLDKVLRQEGIDKEDKDDTDKKDDNTDKGNNGNPEGGNVLKEQELSEDEINSQNKDDSADNEEDKITERNDYLDILDSFNEKDKSAQSLEKKDEDSKTDKAEARSRDEHLDILNSFREDGDDSKNDTEKNDSDEKTEMAQNGGYLDILDSFKGESREDTDKGRADNEHLAILNSFEKDGVKDEKAPQDDDYLEIIKSFDKEPTDPEKDPLAILNSFEEDDKDSADKDDDGQDNHDYLEIISSFDREKDDDASKDNADTDETDRDFKDGEEKKDKEDAIALEIDSESQSDQMDDSEKDQDKLEENTKEDQTDIEKDDDADNPDKDNEGDETDRVDGHGEPDDKDSTDSDDSDKTEQQEKEELSEKLEAADGFIQDAPLNEQITAEDDSDTPNKTDAADAEEETETYGSAVAEESEDNQTILNKYDDQTDIAVALEEDKQDDDSQTEDLQDIRSDIENACKGDEELENVMEKISDSLADDTFSLDDLFSTSVDAVSDALYSNYDIDPQVVSDICAEISSIMDEPVSYSIDAFLNGLSDNGIDDEFIDDVSYGIPESLDNMEYSSEEYGQYENMSFTDFETNPFDNITGEVPDISNDALDYEHIQNDMEPHIQDISLEQEHIDSSIDMDDNLSGQVDYQNDMSDIGESQPFDSDDAHKIFDKQDDLFNQDAIQDDIPMDNDSHNADVDFSQPVESFDDSSDFLDEAEDILSLIGL